MISVIRIVAFLYKLMKRRWIITWLRLGMIICSCEIWIIANSCEIFVGEAFSHIIANIRGLGNLATHHKHLLVIVAFILLSHKLSQCWTYFLTWKSGWSCRIGRAVSQHAPLSTSTRSSVVGSKFRLSLALLPLVVPTCQIAANLGISRPTLVKKQ